MTETLSVEVPHTAHEVASIQREIEGDVPAFKALAVETTDDLAIADELLTDVVRRKDALVAMRKSATGPLYGVIKTVEAWFAPAVSAFAEAEWHLKGAIARFRVAQAEAEALARKAAADAATAGDSAALVASLNAATEAQARPAGNASVSLAWQVKRIAEDLLPDEFWIPDRARLDALAKAHKGDDPPVVPGVVFERVANVRAGRGRS